MTLHGRLGVAACALCALAAGGTARAEAPGAGQRMKAIVYREYGSPDVLRLEEIEKPVPRDDQILVRVRAASVNPLDWHFVRGEPYLVRTETGLFRPNVPRLGVDVAGEVEAVGRKVTRFKPGDEVFGHRFGAFAEYVTAGEGRFVTKPPGLTFEEAASVPVAAITALQGLRDEGRLRPGQKVLVNGASGGVGTFAVQIAKALGAEVTGVCSTRNAALVRSLGADRVIDYAREDFTKGAERYDVVLDMIGNHSLSATRRVLAPGGRLVIVGSIEKGRWLGPMRRAIEAAAYSMVGSKDAGFMLAKVTNADLAVVRDLLASGKVKPVIDRRYPLAQVPEALRYVEAGHARGKVVITVGEGSGAAPAGPGSATAAGAPGARGTEVAAAGLVALTVAGPIAAALALNRRFQRRNPGKRPYRWGYWMAIQSLLGGIALGVVLEAGAAVAAACALAYALLAWSFALRHRWAWVVLTLATFNPVAWVVNLVYLGRRWREDTRPRGVDAAPAGGA